MKTPFWIACRVVVVALVAAVPALASGPPDGSYNCWVVLGGKTNKVGSLDLDGAKYASKDLKGNGAGDGTYRFDPGASLVTFDGKPPLEFKLGVYEVDSQNNKYLVRLYKEQADVGKKWKGIFCSPRK